ncbi:phosphoinositide phosphatase SAC2-like [Amaranthus tricolor]|uniref:phosphoinositide phosphatase SAC2-like n=1 Tax=Amaranthus tricolor TaxID=29722 RepID=UPI0025846631|nr:phosphoinositide phosphatase SAC2-like [Amaranthus tricolor]XP_057535661.1 phosphoinositide phosphatase SAC2-like [Amaranthus tricolor]XP_057535662.1 phosphoinositide phosphatase SAC2-like [Amaranthus tricolor]
MELESVDHPESNHGQAQINFDKFTLFKTSSNFYLIGRDVERRHWRVLKIGRCKPSALVIHEDPTIYTRKACKLLLRSIDEGNKSTGGLKFVTDSYGIIGFIKVLESYYILLVTERKKIGEIFDHPIYSISEYRMIPISHSSALTYMYNSTKENRYKKLLQLVDIRDNFFFSYSYPVMHRVQQNLSNEQQAEHSSDGKIFIWNEFITRKIRDDVKNTNWTVALVHGFFKQVELATGGKTFVLTLIARRSCQFAGTRYEKRGVNEQGHAANFVEIEQIIWQAIPSERPAQITSVVQVRGSIPLCWSQKPSMLNLKPDILLLEGNDSYASTRLHFQSLCLRYGSPIVILNLIKTCKKKHREFVLHEEFSKAVASINNDLSEEDKVLFFSLDLDAVFQDEGADEISELKCLAANALMKTGIFSSQMPRSVNFEASFDLSFTSNNDVSIMMQQKGILRTNCLDSLDRTNFAQYVFGVVALGYQLDDLRITESRELDFKNSLAYDLMSIYQAMGDALSRQYGGSPAHQKIFSKIKGQWKVASQFQEFTKSVQRHCSNSFLDVTKQQAIDMFLGHFEPEVGELTPQKANLYQDSCKWLKDIYLKKIPRCNLCIYSGFERLWFDESADRFHSRCLTFPCRGSQHGSQEGYALIDFPADPGSE